MKITAVHRLPLGTSEYDPHVIKDCEWDRREFPVVKSVCRSNGFP